MRKSIVTPSPAQCFYVDEDGTVYDSWPPDGCVIEEQRPGLGNVSLTWLVYPIVLILLWILNPPSSPVPAMHHGGHFEEFEPSPYRLFDRWNEERFSPPLYFIRSIEGPSARIQLRYFPEAKPLPLLP